VDLDANIIIGAAIGTVITALLAQLRRSLSRTRFWRGIERTAGETMRDPNVPVDDPGEAAARALVEQQRPQLDAVARKLSKSIPPQNVTRGDGA